MSRRERTYWTEAIILRRTDFGEVDRLLTVLQHQEADRVPQLGLGMASKAGEAMGQDFGGVGRQRVLLDGVEKMSKSLGNYVGIDEPPREMFGKMMSVPDSLMLRYYELLSDISPEDLAKLTRDLDSGAKHPRDAKEELAREITARYHGDAAAADAAREFAHIFREGGLPEEIEEAVLEGARTYLELQEYTKLGTVCGQCKDEAIKLLNQYKEEHFGE